MIRVDSLALGRTEIGDGLLAPALQDQLEGMRMDPLALLSSLGLLIIDLRFRGLPMKQPGTHAGQEGKKREYAHQGRSVNCRYHWIERRCLFRLPRFRKDDGVIRVNPEPLSGAGQGREAGKPAPVGP